MEYAPAASMTEPSTAWRVTSRLEELRGEQRANGLRVLGVAVFYAIEVVNYRGLSLGPIELAPVPGVTASFHAMATALAVAWLAIAGAVLLAVQARTFPPALKYLSTGFDLVLLTAVLTLADGPRSPLLLGYFLLIPLAGLRLSPRLVVVTTVGALLGYGFLLADLVVRRPELEVPAHWQVTTTAALLLAGVTVTALVRGVHRAALAYSELAQSEPEPDPATTAPRKPSEPDGGGAAI